MTRAKIVELIAPSTAVPGDLVSVKVRIKNVFHDWLWMSVFGHFDGIDLYFSPEDTEVGEGETVSFTSSFTMPDRGTNLNIWSFYSDGVQWIEDDFATSKIRLSIVGNVSAIWMWHPGQTREVIGAPKEIEMGREVRLSVSWNNIGEAAFVGHVDLTVTYPDGTIRSLAARAGAFQDRELLPGYGASTDFQSFSSLQRGRYVIRAILTSGAIRLDEMRRELVAALIFIEERAEMIKLTVTNQSTKDGVAVSAVLRISIRIVVDSLTLIEQVGNVSFGAGQTRSLIYPVTPPIGSAGKRGAITASVADPMDNIIDEDTEEVTIV